MRGLRGTSAELALYLALSIHFVWPILMTGAALGIEDWDPLLFQHGAVLRSTVEFLRPPFWNPWSCGGNVLWQNAQAPLLTPVYALALVFDLAVAMKIGIALHYFAGFAGMYVLLRRALRVEPFVWRFALAGMFTMAGGAALHLAVGHAAFLPYFYLPWVLWLFIAAVDAGSLRHAAAAGAVLAFAVWNGGVYVVVMGAVGLSVFAVAASAWRRDWRPLVLLGFAGVTGALLAAPKLLPVLLYVADPRKIDIRTFPPGPDVMSPSMLLASLMEPFQHRHMDFIDQKYGWAEYGNYLGPFGIFLIGGAAVLSAYRAVQEPGAWPGVALAATALVLLLIAAGDFASVAPYAILRRLPGLEDLRVPSRYLLPFTLFATALVGWAVGSRGGAPGRPLPPVLAMALVLGTIFMGSVNRRLFEGAFPYEPLGRSFGLLARPPAPAVDPVTDGWSPDSPMLRGLMANRGVLRCNEPFHLPGRVEPSRSIVFGEGGAVVSDVSFSPNRIRFDVTSGAAAARLFLNQRYVSGWTSTAGPLEIDPSSGLAAVSLPAAAAGTHAFSFTPPGLYAGFGLCSAGLLLVFVLRNRRI